MGRAALKTPLYVRFESRDRKVVSRYFELESGSVSWPQDQDSPSDLIGGVGVDRFFLLPREVPLRRCEERVVGDGIIMLLTVLQTAAKIPQAGHNRAVELNALGLLRAGRIAEFLDRACNHYLEDDEALKEVRGRRGTVGMRDKKGVITVDDFHLRPVGRSVVEKEVEERGAVLKGVLEVGDSPNRLWCISAGGVLLYQGPRTEVIDLRLRREVYVRYLLGEL